MKNEGDFVNVVILYPFHNFSRNTWNSMDDPLNPGWEELLYWILDSMQHQCQYAVSVLSALWLAMRW